MYSFFCFFSVFFLFFLQSIIVYGLNKNPSYSHLSNILSNNNTPNVYTLNIEPSKSPIYIDSLFTALGENDLKAVKKFAKKVNNLNQFYEKYNASPFSFACYNCNSQIIKYLAGKGGDLSKIDFVQVLGKNEDKTTLELLIEKGIDINRSRLNQYNTDFEATPFAYACYKCNSKIVKYMINQGADLSTINFYKVISENNDKMVWETLVSNGIDINKRSEWEGHAPLYDLFGNSKDPAETEYKTAKWLLEHGADVNTTEPEGCPAIGMTTDSLFLELYAAHKANFNISNNYLFRKAKTKQMIFYLNHGADPNYRNNAGEPLYFLINDESDEKLSELFFTKGADLNLKNNDGHTFLMNSIINNQVKTVDRILKKNFDINIKDYQGRTALFYAIFSRNKELVEKLIAKGADIYIKDNEGTNPILYAVLTENLDIAKLLVGQKTDMNEENLMGETAMKIAKRRNYTEFIAFLKEKGANENTGHSIPELIVPASQFYCISKNIQNERYVIFQANNKPVLLDLYERKIIQNMNYQFSEEKGEISSENGQISNNFKYLVLAKGSRIVLFETLSGFPLKGMKLSGKDIYIKNCYFSSDDNYLFCVTNTSIVCIDIAKWKQINEIETGKYTINSDDNNFLITASYNGILTIRNSSTGQIVREKNIKNSVDLLTKIPNSNNFITNFNDSTLGIVSINSLEFEKTIPVGKGAISFVKNLEGNKVFYSQKNEKTKGEKEIKLCIASLNTTKIEKTISVGTEDINFVKILNENIIWFVQDDSYSNEKKAVRYCLKQWDIKQNKIIPILYFFDNTIDISKDNKFLVNYKSVIDLKTGEELLQSKPGRAEPRIILSPDNKMLYYTNEDKWIIRNLTGNELKSEKNKQNAGQLSNSGRYLWNNSDIRAFSCILNLKTSQTLNATVTKTIENIIFTKNDSLFLAFGKTSHEVALCSAEIDQVLKTFSVKNKPIKDASFFANEKEIVIGVDSLICFFDCNTQKINKTISHTKAYEKFVISKDENTLHIANSDRTIDIYDLNLGKIVKSITLLGMEFTDAKYYSFKLIANDQFYEINYRNWGTTLFKRNGSHEGFYQNYIESSDGLLLFEDYSNELHLLRADTYKSRQNYHGHKDWITCAQLSNNEKFLWTASKDNTIKLWDFISGKEICTYIPIDSTDWTVTTPSGLFDASPAAMKKLYFVQGFSVSFK